MLNWHAVILLPDLAIFASVNWVIVGSGNVLLPIWLRAIIKWPAIDQVTRPTWAIADSVS